MNLKPCPFCGARARLEVKPMDGGYYEYLIKCTGCGVSLPLGPANTMYRTEQEAMEYAIEVWNRRSFHAD